MKALFLIIQSIILSIIFGLSWYYFSQQFVVNADYGLFDPSKSNTFVTNNGFNIYFIAYPNNGLNTLTLTILPSSCSQLYCGTFVMNFCQTIFERVRASYIASAYEENPSPYPENADGDLIYQDETMIINLRYFWTSNYSIPNNTARSEQFSSQQDFLSFDSWSFNSLVNYSQVTGSVNFIPQNYDYNNHILLGEFLDLTTTCLINSTYMNHICDVIPNHYILTNQYSRSWKSYKSWYEVLTLSVSITGFLYNLITYLRIGIDSFRIRGNVNRNINNNMKSIVESNSEMI
jgi:hypothetical protein